jgi:hypothetical protein
VEIIRTASDGTPNTISANLTSVADLFAEVPKYSRALPPRQDYVIEQPGADETGAVEVKLPLKLEAEYIQTGCLAAVQEWEVWRQFPWEFEPVRIGSQLHPRIDWIEDGSSSVALHRPYLFTDRHATKGQRLLQPGLVADQTVVRYHVRPIPLLPTDADRRPPDSGAEWLSVVLNIPPKDPLPAELAMVWPVESLLTDAVHAFSLATTRESPSGDRDYAPVLSSRDSESLLGIDEFELLAEELTVGQTGFYGLGDENGAAARPLVSTTLASVRAGATAAPAETLHGKFSVPLERTSSGGAQYQITTEGAKRFVAGKAYRFFIRPKQQAALARDPQPYGLVKALPIILTKQLADLDGEHRWRELPGQLTEPVVEFIPRAVLTQLQTDPTVKVHELPLVVSTRSLDDEVDIREARTQIGVRWNLHDVLNPLGAIGGVEIKICDCDDSTADDQFLCEALGEAQFRVNRSDFRSASGWRITPYERKARRAFSTRPPVVAADPPLDIPLEVMIDRDTRGNPVLQLLEERIAAFKASFDRPARPWWEKRWKIAKDLLQAISEYRKSPVNLGDPQISEVMNRIESLVQWHLVGISPPAITAEAQWTAEARRTTERMLLAMLQDIEQYQQPIPQGQRDIDPKECRRAFLDAELAKQLAVIVRQRLAVRADLLTGASDDLPDQEEASKSWLPGGDFFEETRQKIKNLVAELGPFERCQKLLALFPESDAVLANTGWAYRRLTETNLLDQLKNLATYADVAAPSPRTRAAAGLLPQGTGLNVVLRHLRERFRNRGWRLIRRPHHGVVRGEVRDGVPQAETTQFTDLFSDDVRLNAALGDRNSEPAPDRELPALFNLLEKMGFAVDIAAQDVLGEIVEADDLAREIQRAGLHDVLALHDLTLVLGREQDSEHLQQAPDPEDEAAPRYYFVGYSFAKLVVMPKAFVDSIAYRQLIARPNDNTTTRGQIDATVDFLKKWFGMRGITFQGDAAVHLERIGGTIAYLRYPLAGDVAATNSMRRLRLESFDIRWRSLPLVAGWGRADWTLPNRRGRRLARPVARVVSRFEPLLRWALQLPQPIWPEDRTVTLDLPRLTIGDPKPDDFEQDLPEWLPVAVHPHPQQVAFSVTLPAAAARSLQNQISAIRTGYSGYTLAFHYKFADNPQPPLTWAKVLANMKYVDPSSELIADRPANLSALPTLRPLEPRLFPHERLITVADQPYIYEFRLKARSQFHMTPLGPTAPVLPPRSFLPALREPSLIAARLPDNKRENSNATSEDWTITLLLTRTGDLLTPTELQASPPLVPMAAAVTNPSGSPHNLQIPPDRLPELAMAYHFYCILGTDDNACYVDVAELIMPWHTSYSLPIGSEIPKPLFRALAPQVVVADERPHIECGLPAVSSTDYVYRVTLKFKTTLLTGDTELLFADPDKRRLRVSRGGHLSPFMRLLPPS